MPDFAPLANRRAVSVADAAREPFLGYTREEYPDYFEYLASMFAAVKTKPRKVEEHDGFSSLTSAIEAGREVAFVAESFPATSRLQAPSSVQ